MYGLKHNLTLTRNDNNDAIYRGANAVAGGALAIGKVVLSKISWFMPHVTPADKDKMELYKIIERKEKIPVGYRMIQCDSALISQNSTNFSWRLSVKSSPEVPRFIIVGFQAGKSGNQQENPSIYDNINVNNIYTMLNSTRYPTADYKITFVGQKFSRVYGDVAEFRAKFFNMDELVSSPNITPADYRTLYPLFLFDVSQNLARERGLTRYSRLRKSELIRRLREQSILEWGNDAAMTNVPFLTPTPYTPPPSTTTPIPPSNTIKDLIKYLDNVKEIPKSVSPNLKKLKKKIDDIYKKTKIFEVKESDSALRNFAKVYTIDGKEGFDPQSFMDGVHENMTELLRNNRNTKVKLILKCYMISEKENLIRDFPFHSNIEVNVEGTDENDIYIIMTDTILERIANLINGSSGGGSDWAFYKVIKLELHTVSYRPLRGNTWIPLPKELADKKAIINMKNKDNKCLLWCVLRKLNPKDDNAERVDKELMEKENTLNMEGIEYPVSFKDINKFEKQNPNISITVLGYNEKDKVHPLSVSEYVYNREHNIILLLIERDGVKRYCLVKNPSRLLSKQISAHKKGTHICFRCLNPFWSHKSLEKHWE